MRRIATLAAGIALMAPATAMAESSSSTCQAYNPQLCNSFQQHNGTEANDGTLPFTGLDVALLAAGGGTLLAAGAGMRRLSRQID